MKNIHNYFRVIGLVIILGAFALLVVDFVMFLKEQNKFLPLLFVSLAFIFIGLITYNISTNNSRKRCNSCGGSMKGTKYSYKEISKKVKRDGSGVDYAVSITATCPHCGKKKVFFKDIHVSNNENLKSKVDSFCEKKF